MWMPGCPEVSMVADRARLDVGRTGTGWWIGTGSQLLDFSVSPCHCGGFGPLSAASAVGASLS